MESTPEYIAPKQKSVDDDFSKRIKVVSAILALAIGATITLSYFIH